MVSHLGIMYLKLPSTAEEWLIISKLFEDKWHYPHCLGAIDGKHSTIQPPANCGSHYYSYKHSHSIVLLVVAGPNYECLYADVGTIGRISDGGVWHKCHFAQKLDGGELALPAPEPIPFGKYKFPFIFVADDAFALKEHLMKPYPQSGLTDDKRIYNYRHVVSTIITIIACRISENCFGIIANRWRLFRSAILLPPDTIKIVVMATLALHIFLRKSASRSIYWPTGLVDYEDSCGNVVKGIWHHSAPTASMLALHKRTIGQNSCKKPKR